MIRFIVQFTHVPGAGTRDHLAPAFLAAMHALLKPDYTGAANARQAVERFWSRAVQQSQFDGTMRYRIVPRDDAGL